MVTLPDPDLFPTLADDFVLGWRNIRREDHVGYSFGYGPADSAVGTTNGAGPHNVQIFVLTADLVVLHALPGFWHPDDLARELRLAQTLLALWRDPDRTREQKDAMFAALQRSSARYAPAETRARSSWQSFDVFEERQRLQVEGIRDTFLLTEDGSDYARDAGGHPRLKPIDLLVHDRMAARPFVRFSRFDVAAFTDYGRLFYDNNIGVDGQGRRFAGQKALQAQRNREERRKRREEKAAPSQAADM